MKFEVFFVLFYLACIFAENLTVRIKGGDFAEENQFPHQVALFRNETFECGGAIIDDRHVLTSGFCAKRLKPNFVLAGTNSLSDGGIRMEIDRMVPHPEYKGAPGIRKNIAIVRLKEQFVFYESIQPIEMYNFYPLRDEDLIISGWGRTSQNGPLSDSLKFTYAKALTPKACSGYVNSAHQHFYDVPSTMCIDRIKGGGICSRDVGGGVVYHKKLVGIMSFFYLDCGENYLPDAYSAVPYFYNWIKDTVEKFNSGANYTKAG